jgi:hypothetical protein
VARGGHPTIAGGHTGAGTASSLVAVASSTSGECVSAVVGLHRRRRGDQEDASEEDQKPAAPLSLCFPFFSCKTRTFEPQIMEIMFNYFFHTYFYGLRPFEPLAAGGREPLRTGEDGHHVSARGEAYVHTGDR